MKRENWIGDVKSQTQKRFRIARILLTTILVSALSWALSIQGVLRRELQDAYEAEIQSPDNTHVPTRAKESHTEPLLYPEWRQIAVQLAELSARDALDALRNKDPFQTRAFSKRLTAAEEVAGGPLSLTAIKQLFGGCPTDRLSQPNQRDSKKATSFRNGNGFLYFQHLRKAGGTHFCTLARDNLPKINLPPYYCMPDKAWSWENKTKIQVPRAGRLHHWSNEEILNNIGKYRIAANEWDSFDPATHFNLPAVIVTSFRNPLDRAVSQFRFECVERGMCKTKNIDDYWTRRRDLHNVYTWTFSDIDRQAALVNATGAVASRQRGKAIGKAMDTLARFNLVLAMEWLAYAEVPVQRELGFKNTTTLTTTVRPHNGKKLRNDSWRAVDYLSADQYEAFSLTLALDEILTDAANRLFLERLVCDHGSESSES